MKKYDLLIIDRSEVIGTSFDDKFGPIIRIKHYNQIRRINWEDFLPDFLNQDFLSSLNSNEKIEMSRYLKEYFSNKFNN